MSTSKPSHPESAISLEPIVTINRPQVYFQEFQDQSGQCAVWLGYRRATDFDSVGDGEAPGQDFAAVKIDARYTVGVVGDGVSTGFFGDIAARVVVKSLIAILWETKSRPPEKSVFEQCLRELENKTEKVVREFRLPDRIEDYKRDYLEELRATHSSQAVFTAFVHDRSNQLTLTAYQVGDPCLLAYLDQVPSDSTKSWKRVSEGAMQVPVLKLVSDPKGRFGPKRETTEHLLTVERLSGVQGLLLHSDGVPDSLGADPRLLGDPAALRNQLNSWGRVDDASFVSFFTPSMRRRLRLDDMHSDFDVREAIEGARAPLSSEVPNSEDRIRPDRQKGLAVEAPATSPVRDDVKATSSSERPDKSANMPPRHTHEIGNSALGSIVDVQAIYSNDSTKIKRNQFSEPGSVSAVAVSEATSLAGMHDKEILLLSHVSLSAGRPSSIVLQELPKKTKGTEARTVFPAKLKAELHWKQPCLKQPYWEMQYEGLAPAHGVIDIELSRDQKRLIYRLPFTADNQSLRTSNKAKILSVLKKIVKGSVALARKRVPLAIVLLTVPLIPIAYYWGVHMHRVPASGTQSRHKSVK